MSHTLRSLTVTAACVLWSISASAQAPAAQTSAASGSPSSNDSPTRPATTTFFGDTGIWFVPTAEVVASGKVSVSGYRRGTNYVQGYTNVADFAGTFAFGIKNRAEVFGSFLADTRIDRDLRPLFGTEPNFGGVISQYPGVHTTWTGDNVGDLYLGVKFNLLSEYRHNPLALAVRAMVKVPTGKTDIGTSTGKTDETFDLIVSKEIAKMTEVSAYGGYSIWGKPDGFDAPSGAFEWGAGASFPSRKPLRIFGEVNGTVLNGNSNVTITGSNLFGTDGSMAPLISTTENMTRATAGVTYQAHNGFFVGGGFSWNVPRVTRLDNREGIESTPFADYTDFQVRIGYHPGTRVYVPHTLSVKADCDPCTVQVGQASTVTATVQDSINCAVTYQWSAPNGTFADPSAKQTRWTSAQAGAVPVTVTVTCPTDNKTASDMVTIQVTAPPAPRPAPEHTLSVTPACNPCEIFVGQTSTLTATVMDSISCAVTYRWSAPSGTFATGTQRQSVWTSTLQPGTVPMTVTVTCPTDNKMASGMVNVLVKPIVFEDVYFDFDRYTLRPEAIRLLDDAITTLQANPERRIIIEGHTCNIGTVEYNLALGERRAAGVRDYLISRGIATARLQIISYGEEAGPTKPNADNSREETRRLNRRAVLVLNMQ